MHSSKCVVLGFNVWRTGMRQRLKGLTSSGYLYRTQCHRHGTGCIHRKGQRIYRLSFSQPSDRRRGTRCRFAFVKILLLLLRGFRHEWSSTNVSSSFRIKKKKTRKKNILLTFFKNGRVIYHYLGLEKELNRMLLRCVVARVSFSIDLQSIKKNSSNFLILPIKLYDILSIQLNIHTRPASERGHERGCRNFLSLKESAWERERDEGNYLNRYVDSCARTTRLPGCIDDLSSPGANGYGQVFIHQRRDVFRSRGRWRYHAMATARAFL